MGFLKSRSGPWTVAGPIAQVSNFELYAPYLAATHRYLRAVLPSSLIRPGRDCWQYDIDEAR